MRVSEDCYALGRKYEGCRLKAYLCPAKRWTIGFGNTYYLDGSCVKDGDSITKDEAILLHRAMVDKFGVGVENLLKVGVNQCQFDAMVDMAYNIGIGAFGRSGLLKLVNANANDPRIKLSFLGWVKVNGKVLEGLVKRAHDRIALYFKEV